MSGTLVFDIESHSVKRLYSMPPEEFVRLIGYKWWGDDKVTLTTDLEEFRELILSARGIVGHNIHTFDLRAIFGIKSNIPMQLADEGKVYDTWTHAAIVNPAPFKYINRFGTECTVTKPEKAKQWFGLDEQAFQLGVKGKTHSLKDLAHEFGDPNLPDDERIEGGFGRIPVDDPRYMEYLIGDVHASEAVASALLKKGPLNDYAMRRQRVESRKATIQSNGFRVHEERAQARSEFLKERREAIMQNLVRDYNFPTDYASPWASKEGKLAILDILADNGITPSNTEWPKTPAWGKKKEHLAKAAEKVEKLRAAIKKAQTAIDSGDLPPRSVAARERWIERDTEKLTELEANPLGREFGLSFSGDTMVELTQGTPVEALGTALAELMGQRSLADLALDCMYEDGFVHPEITMLQRSLRWSTTEPGLTVWTSRGEGAVEKSYYLPDFDDHVLIEIDLSNADARAVAAYSGDKRYAERFEPGADGHLINAWAAWGKEEVGTDKKDPKTAAYRQLAKPGGHGWGYRIGSKKLASTWKKPVKEAKAFLDNMNKAFKGVVAWQERVTEFAIRHGYVVNAWGHKLPVEAGREYTQGPALLGQNATTEIMSDALLEMSHSAVRSIKAQIHDAMVFSVPRKGWEKYRDYLLQCIESSMNPKGGQYIAFPATCGPPGSNWQEAGHD